MLIPLLQDTQQHNKSRHANCFTVPPLPQRTEMNFNLELQANKQVAPASLSHVPFAEDPLNVGMEFQVSSEELHNIPQADVQLNYHNHTLNIGIGFGNLANQQVMYRLKMFDQTGNQCFYKENLVQLTNKENFQNELLHKPLGRKYKKSKLHVTFELANFVTGLNPGFMTFRRDVLNNIPRELIQNINMRFQGCDIKADACIIAGGGSTFGDVNIDQVIHQQPQQQQSQHQQAHNPQPQSEPRSTKCHQIHQITVRVWNWFRVVVGRVHNCLRTLCNRFDESVKSKHIAMKDVRFSAVS